MDERGEAPENPLWSFSLGFYRREGVSAECIMLQDVYGADVNVVLCCLWLGVGRGVALDDGKLGTLLAAAEGWHNDIVRTLRTARRNIKTRIGEAGAADALYREAKRVELAAERIEQDLLSAATRDWGNDAASASAGTALANLDLYMKRCKGLPAGHETVVIRAALIAAALA